MTSGSLCTDYFFCHCLAVKSHVLAVPPPLKRAPVGIRNDLLEI